MTGWIIIAPESATTPTTISNNETVVHFCYKTNNERFIIERVYDSTGQYHKCFVTLYNGTKIKLLGPAEIFPHAEYISHQGFIFSIKDIYQC